MSCEICGRNSCTRSFHSLEAQERFDELKNNPIAGEKMTNAEAEQEFQYILDNNNIHKYEEDDLDIFIEDYGIEIIDQDK